MALRDKLNSAGLEQAKRGRHKDDRSVQMLARWAKLDSFANSLPVDSDGDRLYLVADKPGVLTPEDIGCENARTMLIPTIKSWAENRGYVVDVPAQRNGCGFGVTIPGDIPSKGRKAKA